MRIALLCLAFSACATAPVKWPDPPSSQSTRRILVVVTSHAEFGGGDRKTGYWLSELSHFLWEAQRHGFAVDVVSPQGGKPPLDEASRDLSDPINVAFLGAQAAVEALEHSRTPAEVQPERYAAIYFVGGHGPLWDFPDDAQLQALTVAIYERGGVVAAVCHGPAALLNVKLSDGKSLLEGREVTGLSNTEEFWSGNRARVPFSLEDELVKRGARYHSAMPFSSNVKVSGRLVTGQNPQSSSATAEAVLTLLATP
jgi:putative intracellular protease/amidase